MGDNPEFLANGFGIWLWTVVGRTAKLKEEQQQQQQQAAGTNNNNASAFEDQNPFVPAREAQRMMGAYPEDDVARASLEQLNEISRRATAAGMTFVNGNGANGASAAVNGQNGRPMTPASAQRILAAAAGMLQGQNPSQQQQQQQQQQSQQRQQQQSPPPPNGLPPNLTREDTLQRIEELARQRPASQQGMRLPGPSAVGPSMNSSGMGPGLVNGSGLSGAQQQQQQQVLPSMQYTTTGEPFMMPGPESGALDVYAGNAGGGSIVVPPATSITHSGLQVFTLGHLMPKSTGDDDSAIWSFDPMRQQGGGAGPSSGNGGGSGGAGGSYGDAGQASASISDPEYDVDNGGAGSSSSSSITGAGAAGAGAGPVSRPGSAQKLRVRRSTFVPGWAVPPRVLLVDDDAVSRKLSSKFLQVFGCTIDVAVDGVVAVNKMNLEKYDLVLMVCVFSFLFSFSFFRSLLRVLCRLCADD